MTERLSEAGSLRAAIERVSKLAAALNRPCAIIGGAAMVLRVRPRPTFDVDLVVKATKKDVDAILETARGLGLTLVDDPVARELADEGLVQLDGPEGAGESLGADLIFADSAFLERVIERATRVDGPFDVPVATPEDLLLLKLEANRPVDVDDALAIKDAFADALDRDYLRVQGELLGLRAKLETLLGPLAPEDGR